MSRPTGTWSVTIGDALKPVQTTQRTQAKFQSTTQHTHFNQKTSLIIKRFSDACFKSGVNHHSTSKLFDPFCDAIRRAALATMANSGPARKSPASPAPTAYFQ